MKNIFAKVPIILGTITGLLIAITVTPPQAQVPSLLIQQDLFFGRNISRGGEVSEQEFQSFVDSVITPRFPAGLTIVDADGQYLDSTGIIIEEESKVVSLLLSDTLENQASIQEIIQEYRQQFQQESVLQVANKDDLKVSFGSDGNLIKNDPIPELIQVDLFFGRNIPGGGKVSEQEFQGFVDSVITPRFPGGLTIVDADGQYLDSTETIIEEESKVVSLLLSDTWDNEASIREIIEQYRQQFQQESVLVVANEDVTVSFDTSGDLIDNDPIPELIQVDLFFGRNIPGGGEVSEQEFQGFVDSVITPRFQDGLTIVDSDGQYLDSTGTIIEEQSKVVSFIFEDTLENEASIREVIEQYRQQFQQESVLLVVDEDIETYPR